MKLIKISKKSNHPFLEWFLSSKIYLKTFFSLALLGFVAFAIWKAGPFLSIGHHAPLSSVGKRIYLIVFLFLAWLLKFLLVDLDIPNPFQFKDPQLRQNLKLLQQKFHGALHFLQQSKIKKQNRTVRLSSLPWYLLIGPKQAGKTGLLTHSNVHFILQKHAQPEKIKNINFGNHVDWWVTRELCIIDVPSYYLCSQASKKSKGKRKKSTIWPFFLHLIQKYRTKNSISGVIITLPLPELIKHGDFSQLRQFQYDLLNSLEDLKKISQQTIPCQLLITKCDHLNGFSEFFSESGQDETEQAWCMLMPAYKNDQELLQLFHNRFDVLIKKLNQQLLWRMHQERNSSARPLIKDFPLEVEKLKESIVDFLKIFSKQLLHFPLKGVYLTSACQDFSAQSYQDIAHNQTHDIQIFKNPENISRPYFVKQFITNGLTPNKVYKSLSRKQIITQRMVYSTSILIIGGATFILAKDFQKGVNKTYTIQNYLSAYQFAIQKDHNQDEHLKKVNELMDGLQALTKQTNYQLDFSHLVSFYSGTAQKNMNQFYQEALRIFLIPETKKYLEEYLKIPVNKNSDYLYAALKSYLMFDNQNKVQPDFLINTMTLILPSTMSDSEKNHFVKHLSLALNRNLDKQILNQSLIDQTRQYLKSMPQLQLSFIILKNIDHNNRQANIPIFNLGNHTVFVFKKPIQVVPIMFTGSPFKKILLEETARASEEAVIGNATIGKHPISDQNEARITELTQKLRIAYVSHFIDIWENILNNLTLNTPADLKQTNEMIKQLISDDSPLLQVLQTIHANTFFDPIFTIDPAFKQLGELVENNNTTDNLLYQIFASLKLVNHYLQPIVDAENKKEAAFQAISKRIQDQNSPGPIIQLRLVANQCPSSIKNWLNHIADYAWNYLMDDANKYLDTSWQDHVIRFYDTEIANRYPFAKSYENEVPLKKFIQFFGHAGLVMNFYNQYLSSFIDTSQPDWRWKNLHDQKLPFSSDALRQIQQAVHINQVFFPDQNKNMLIKFALKPYKFGESIKTVQWQFNNKKIIDNNFSKNEKIAPHILEWPYDDHQNDTVIEMTLSNNQILKKRFNGEWGWFKLISQSFETIISKKQIVINLSENEQPVKYILYSDGSFNPFLALNLNHFQLSSHLIKQLS